MDRDRVTLSLRFHTMIVKFRPKHVKSSYAGMSPISASERTTPSIPLLSSHWCQTACQRMNLAGTCIAFPFYTCSSFQVLVHSALTWTCRTGSPPSQRVPVPDTVPAASMLTTPSVPSDIRWRLASHSRCEMPTQLQNPTCGWNISRRINQHSGPNRSIVKNRNETYRTKRRSILPQ